MPRASICFCTEGDDSKDQKKKGSLILCDVCRIWYHHVCLLGINKTFKVPSHDFSCPICTWHDSLRDFQELSFDLNEALEVLRIMERVANDTGTRDMMSLADAAYGLRREFEGVREKGMPSHRERERNCNRSAGAVREEWARGVRHRIVRLGEAMRVTHIVEELGE